MLTASRAHRGRGCRTICQLNWSTSSAICSASWYCWSAGIGCRLWPRGALQDADDDVDQVIPADHAKVWSSVVGSVRHAATV